MEYDPFASLAKYFTTNQEIENFLNTVERSENFPSWPVGVDKCEEIIILQAIEIFAHKKYIDDLQEKFNVEQREYAQKLKFINTENEAILILELHFKYRTSKAKLKIDYNLYRSDEVIAKFLSYQYPDLKKFKILEIYTPKKVKFNFNNFIQTYSGLEIINYELIE